MVWQDKEVGQFANEKLINLRIDTSDEAYPALRTKYKTPGTPTVLFLTGDDVEVDRFVGFGGDRDETFQMVKDFVAGVNTLPALLSELETNKEDVETNYKLAKKYQTRYELAKAFPHFEKVLELDADDTKGYFEESSYERAIYLARTKQDPEPLKAFIATDPDEKYLVDAYTTLAYAYQRKKEFEKVPAVYDEALAKLPDSARLMYSYASAIFRGKMEDLYEKGLELNTKAKSLDKNLEMATTLNLVAYYTNIGNTEKLIETFESGVKDNPDSSGLKYTYASTIAQQKIESKYDYAIELLNKELEEDPKAGYMWYALSQIYKNKNEKPKAIDALRRAVELSPRVPTYKKALEELTGESEQKD